MGARCGVRALKRGDSGASEGAGAQRVVSQFCDPRNQAVGSRLSIKTRQGG